MLEQFAVQPEQAPEAIYSQLNVQLMHFSSQVPPQVALHCPVHKPEQVLLHSPVQEEEQLLPQAEVQSDEQPLPQEEVQPDEQPLPQEEVQPEEQPLPQEEVQPEEHPVEHPAPHEDVHPEEHPELHDVQLALSLEPLHPVEHELLQLLAHDNTSSILLSFPQDDNREGRKVALNSIGRAVLAAFLKKRLRVMMLSVFMALCIS